MDHSSKPILVTGATGKQGGAAADHLLRNGWQVRILTRHPSDDKARSYADRGAQIFQGDFEDRSSLQKAIEGCYGAFSVQNPWECGVEAEVRQGCMFADIAADADVRHFIYSSVASAPDSTGIPHFDSKWKVEQHIAGLDLPCTVLRPVYFMENFVSLPDLRQGIEQGTFRMAMRPDRPLELVAVDDIGGIAAMAFDDPDRWVGEAIDIAGDSLTMPDVAKRLSSQLGHAVLFEAISVDDVRKAAGDDAAVMYDWFNRTGYSVDIGGVRKMYRPLKNFDTWLMEHSIWAKQPV